MPRPLRTPRSVKQHGAFRATARLTLLFVREDARGRGGWRGRWGPYPGRVSEDPCLPAKKLILNPVEHCLPNFPGDK